MNIVAIICVRNGAHYVDNCLNHLITNGIDVAVLDQMSNDGTYELCQKFLGNGLCHLSRFEYPGYLSMKDLLVEKQKLVRQLKADWVIHHDIDECMESAGNHSSLSEALSSADSEGFNAINFNEFVFLPFDTEDDRYHLSRHYYFFQPDFPRLVRAWKVSANLSNIETGGHRLNGDCKLSPVTHSLRHYMFTSQAHALEKYSLRRFSEKEIQRGWHLNQCNIPRQDMIFPEANRLMSLPTPKSRNFDTSQPQDKHYWAW